MSTGNISCKLPVSNQTKMEEWFSLGINYSYPDFKYWRTDGVEEKYFMEKGSGNNNYSPFTSCGTNWGFVTDYYYQTSNRRNEYSGTTGTVMTNPPNTIGSSPTCQPYQVYSGYLDSTIQPTFTPQIPTATQRSQLVLHLMTYNAVDSYNARANGSGDGSGNGIWDLMCKPLSSTVSVNCDIYWALPSLDPTALNENLYGETLGNFTYTPADMARFNKILSDNNLVDFTNATTWDNKNDGNISSSNPRTKVGMLTYSGQGYGSSPAWIQRSICGRINVTNENSSNPRIYQYLLFYHCFLGHLPISIASSGLDSFYPTLPYYYRWADVAGTPQANIYGINNNIKGSRICTGAGLYIVQHRSDGAQDSCYYLPLTTRERLNENVNAIGLAWTYSIGEAQNSNTTDDNAFNDFNDTQSDANSDPETPSGDLSSDPITIDIPSVTPDGAFSSVYGISKSQVISFSQFLWGANSWIPDLNQLFTNPAEAIISLKYFPIDLTPYTGANTNIVIGNVSTGVTGSPISSSRVLFDMGSIAVNGYYGSYLDYAPNTDYSIYLPYIGIRKINANDILGTTLDVQYAIDIVTGDTTCMVFAGTQLLYVYNTNIAIDVPLSSTNAMQKQAGLIGGLAMGAIGAGATLATGGAAAPLAAGLVMGAASQTLDSAKVSIDRGGISGSTAGLFTPQYCYLIIDRPHQKRPKTYAHDVGYAYYGSTTIKNLSGYFSVSEVDVSGVALATEEEKAEIKSLLISGVYQYA